MAWSRVSRRGGARPLAGRAAHIRHRGAGLSALGDLLSRFGQYSWCGHHLHSDDAPHAGHDQRDARPVRTQGSAMAERSATGTAVHCLCRCVERRRACHGHLHGGHRLHTAGFLRGLDHRRCDRHAELLEHHTAARATGDCHRGAAQSHWWAALFRSHLGDDQGRTGFTSDVLASVVYKRYQAGFYGLSTAGNVVLFVLVGCIAIPLSIFLNRREVNE